MKHPLNEPRSANARSDGDERAVMKFLETAWREPDEGIREIRGPCQHYTDSKVIAAEQCDPRARRQLGNFPQAFSHVGLINTARNLSREGGPAQQREKEGRR